MKAFFWILLLGNLILFAVMQRGGLGGGAQAYQPQPALHEQRIRLLDTSQGVSAKVKAESVPVAPPMGATAQLAASSPVPLSAPSASSVSVANTAQGASQVQAGKPALVADKQNNPICLEWGEFSDADLDHATNIISALQLGDKSSQRQIEYDKGYWVYIPPLKNRAAVNRKISQLKVRGVNDYFVVWDAGPTQFAISLGVFKTQEAASGYLKQLRSRDVRTAQVGERASKLKTTLFVLNGVDAQTSDKLFARQEDFPGVELKNIPCALTN